MGFKVTPQLSPPFRSEILEMSSRMKSKRNRQRSKNRGLIDRASNNAGGATTFSAGTIIPDRAIRYHNCSYTGAIPTSGLTAATTAFFVVKGNSDNKPFNTSNSISSVVSTVSGGSSVNNQLNGRTLMSSLYETYRGNVGKIRVKCSPSGSGDQVMVGVFAVNNDTLVTLTLPLTFSQLQNQACASWRVCTVGSPVDQNQVVAMVKSSAILGLKPRQYDDQLPTPVANDPNALAWFWIVQIFALDNATNGATIVVDCDVEQEIEWSSPYFPYG